MSTMNEQAARKNEINTSLGHRRVYLRDTVNSLPATTDKSEQYSRKQATDIFAKNTAIDTVEYVTTGNKTDSTFVGRGIDTPPAGVHVIIASTGGKWGKSRREFVAR